MNFKLEEEVAKVATPRGKAPPAREIPPPPSTLGGDLREAEVEQRKRLPGKREAKRKYRIVEAKRRKTIGPSGRE